MRLKARGRELNQVMHTLELHNVTGDQLIANNANADE